MWDLNEPNQILAAARFYFNELGWSIIPVGKNKKPLIESWKKYQKEKPTLEEIESWFSKPETNIALVTGLISGIAVVDIDVNKKTRSFDPEVLEFIKLLPITFMSRTPSGGLHYFYRIDKLLKSKNRIKPFVDLKAEGGYVILPPSTSKGDKNYEFLN